LVQNFIGNNITPSVSANNVIKKKIGGVVEFKSKH
jgi:hypothetical protein